MLLTGSHQHGANIYLILSAQVVAKQLGVAAAAAASTDDAEALLHALRDLAADHVWNVRRAAAEALPSVASAQSPAASASLLELLAALMADASSWVRSAAMLAGGSIIARAPTASVPPGERNTDSGLWLRSNQEFVMFEDQSWGASDMVCRLIETLCIHVEVE